MGTGWKLKEARVEAGRPVTDGKMVTEERKGTCSGPAARKQQL